MGIAWNFDLGMDYSLLHDLERTPCVGKGTYDNIHLKSRGPILRVTSSETCSLCVKHNLNTHR